MTGTAVGRIVLVYVGMEGIEVGLVVGLEGAMVGINDGDLEGDGALVS
jgi:hypothetical protein